MQLPNRPAVLEALRVMGLEARVGLRPEMVGVAQLDWLYFHRVTPWGVADLFTGEAVKGFTLVVTDDTAWVIRQPLPVVHAALERWQQAHIPLDSSWGPAMMVGGRA